jgi:hypothetical protein
MYQERADLHQRLIRCEERELPSLWCGFFLEITYKFGVYYALTVVLSDLHRHDMQNTAIR